MIQHLKLKYLIAAPLVAYTIFGAAFAGAQSQETTLNPGESWSGTIPASQTLSLDGRIVYSKPAGANYVLQVSVDGQPLTSSLTNKEQSFKYQDGRTFNYKLGDAWILFYSPDFNSNNSSAGGGYQVTTDLGQAYHYSWDISSITGGKSQMDITIKNVGPTYPIVGRLTTAGAASIFPIQELGGCNNQKECKAYCDNSQNITACTTYAAAHGMISKEDAARAKEFADVLKGQGPGGCTDQKSCEAYCNGTVHISECVAFGEKHNLIPSDELKQAKQVSAAIAAGAQMPGGCTDKNSCKQYCSDAGHATECFAFAKKAGLISSEEAAQAEKVIPLIQSGDSPGKCTSKEQCQQYCSDSSHTTECVSFAEKAGLMSKEEADIVKKTGGKGPGGCTSKESCDSFCNQKENQQACLSFAKEHDLIPADQLKQIEEGTARLRVGLSQMPGEVVQCLKDKIGADAVGQIESGKMIPSKDISETVQGCFGQFKPQMAAKIQQGLKNAPPEVTSCLNSSLSTDELQKMQSGQIDTPDLGDKVKDCFDKGKEAAKAQMQKGAQQLNNIPEKARDCVKQKLGSDFFDKIQSGNTEEMKNLDQGQIQSAMAECMMQNIPTGNGQNGQGGPTPEQIKRMMQSGASGTFPGVPNTEQFKEMMRQRGGASGTIPSGPTPEQIKEMIQGRNASGTSLGGPTPEQIKNMMQRGGAEAGAGPRENIQPGPTPEQIKEMMQKNIPQIGGGGFPANIPTGPTGPTGPTQDQIKNMIQGQIPGGAQQNFTPPQDTAKPPQ